MNKGETIRHYIRKGLSNDEILGKIDTTINSIRWHRSKMAKPSASVTALHAATSGPQTVGEAAKEFGFEQDIIDCLTRLKELNPTKVPSVLDMKHRLYAWKFVTNSKVGGRFGQCHYIKNQIEVHAAIVSLQADLRKTFLHECAHALDFMIHGRSSGHGCAWQHIMARGFLLPPRATGGSSEAASAALREIRAAKRAAKPVLAIWECTCCGFKDEVRGKRKYPASYYTHIGCGGQFKQI